MYIKTLETPPSNFIDKGNLQINIVDKNNRPIEDASISISYTGNPDAILENIITNASGQTANTIQQRNQALFRLDFFVAQTTYHEVIIFHMPSYTNITFYFVRIF